MTVLRSPLRSALRSPLYSPLVGKWGGAFSPSDLFQSGDILLWYDPSDLTTMFKDTAGTQPVTADGDSVALMLDKGQWGGKSLTQVLAAQPELVTNGGFDSGTGWTLTDATISGGVLTSNAATGVAQQTTTATTGRHYFVALSISGRTTGDVDVGLNAYAEGLNITANGSVSFITLCTGNQLNIRMQNSFNGSIDSISVKEIPGYHRIQATGTSMPKYKTGPNPAAAEASPEMWANPVLTIADFSGTAGAYNTGTKAMTNPGSSFTGYPRFFFDLGLTLGRTYYVSGTITGAISKVAQIRLAASGSSNDVTYTTATGNFSGIVTAAATGIQFLTSLTSSDSGAVISSISVKEIPASAPYIHWLLYDGTDDSTQTPTITWGTDEVAICAGVTKSSDAAIGMVVELSANSGTNSGVFAISAPSQVATADMFFRAGGTTKRSQVVSSLVAPITMLLTGQAKIATDDHRLRVDGAETAIDIDQGSGNFGSYPLYFGRRGGTTLPFNGREYQTVIRSRLLSAAELSSLETFIAAKTGVTL